MEEGERDDFMDQAPGTLLFTGEEIAVYQGKNGQLPGGQFLLVQSPNLSAHAIEEWIREAALFQGVGSSGGIPQIYSVSPWGARVWITAGFLEGTALGRWLKKLPRWQKVPEMVNVGRQLASFLIEVRKAGLEIAWEQLANYCVMTGEGKLLVVPGFFREYFGLGGWSPHEHLLRQASAGLEMAQFSHFLRGLLHRFGPSIIELHSMRSRFLALLERLESEGAALESAEEALEVFYAARAYDGLSGRDPSRKPPSFCRVARARSFLVSLREALKQGGTVLLAVQRVSHSGPKALRDMARRVGKELSKGSTLAHSLSPFREIFPESVLAILKTSEFSGMILKGLDYSLSQLESEGRLRGAALRALARPLILWGVLVSAIGCAWKVTNPTGPVAAWLAGGVGVVMFLALLASILLGVLEDFRFLQAFKLLGHLMESGMDAEEALTAVYQMSRSAGLRRLYRKSLMLLYQGESFRSVCRQMTGMRKDALQFGSDDDDGWFAKLSGWVEARFYEKTRIRLLVPEQAACTAVGVISFLLFYVSLWPLKEYWTGH